MYVCMYVYKRFLACSVLRAASLSTFEIFEVARRQKKALLRVLKFFFYLLTTKDRLTGKTFFRCETPRTALTEIAT